MLSSAASNSTQPSNWPAITKSPAKPWPRICFGSLSFGPQIGPEKVSILGCCWGLDWRVFALDDCWRAVFLTVAAGGACCGAGPCVLSDLICRRIASTSSAPETWVTEQSAAHKAPTKTRDTGLPLPNEGSEELSRTGNRSLTKTNYLVHHLPASESK